jgi:hypothetical protein
MLISHLESSKSNQSQFIIDNHLKINVRNLPNLQYDPQSILILKNNKSIINDKTAGDRIVLFFIHHPFHIEISSIVKYIETIFKPISYPHRFRNLCLPLFQEKRTREKERLSDYNY